MRRGGAGTVVGLVLGGGAVLVVLLLVVGVAALGSGDPSPATAYTARASTAPPARPSPSAAPPSSVVVPGPTLVPTTTAIPPATTTAPAPPPPPQPVVALADNPFHARVGLVATGCGWPLWARDTASQQAFYGGLTECLGQVWAPVLQVVGLPYAPPSVAVFSGTITSPCGGGQDSSDREINFYCGSNDTIYAPEAYLADVEGIPASAQEVFSAMQAHEFGHHVQDQSGILRAYADAYYEAGEGTPAALELSRRLELQAQCLGGMFIGTVMSTTDYDEAVDDAGNRGDHPETGRPPDHGTPEHSGAWFAQGGELNQTFQCNTWAVDASAVS